MEGFAAKIEISERTIAQVINMKIFLAVFAFVIFVSESVAADTIQWNGREFYSKNVHASVVKLNGEEVLKVERDLKALPFDEKRLSATVDEPTYVKLKDFEFADGIFEVKMLAARAAAVDLSCITRFYWLEL